nr:treacle protein-like isoform X2 [Columba livia]
MPMDKKANTQSKPFRLPPLVNRPQVDHNQSQAAPQGSQPQVLSGHGVRLPPLACPESSQAAGSHHTQTDGQAHSREPCNPAELPCTSVPRDKTAHLPALPPLHRPAAAPGPARTAWPPAPARPCCRLSPLPAAPSADAARGAETAVSTADSILRQPVPPAQPHPATRTASRSHGQYRCAPVKDTARCNIVTGSQGLGPQLVQTAGRTVLQAPEDKTVALVNKEEREDERSKERSQLEDITIRTIWVSPSLQDCFQGPHAHPQEGSACPSSPGTEVEPGAENPAPAQHSPTADNVALSVAVKCIVSEVVRKVLTGHQGPSQQPAVKAGKTILQVPEDKPEALAKKEIWEDESSKECSQQENDSIHTIWVSPSVIEHDQDARANPQEVSALASTMNTEAALEAESQAPAQHSPTADNVALSDAVKRIVSEVARKAFTGHQGPSQQPAVKAGKIVPQVPEDKPEALAKREIWEDERSKECSQQEINSIHTIWASPSVMEHDQDACAGPQEVSALASTMKTEAAPAAESQAPAQHSPTANDVAMSDVVKKMVSEVGHKVLTERRGPIQHAAVKAGKAVLQVPEDEPEALATREIWEDESREECSQGENESIHIIWVMEHDQDANEGGQEMLRWPSTMGTEVAPAAESSAPAPHMPTADNTALWDTVQRMVNEAVCRAVAQGIVQQPTEQRDLAQSMDVETAAPTTAGLEATESPLAGQPEEEASTAPLVPAAHNEGENMVSPMSGDYREGAMVSLVAPEEDAASSLPQQPPADAGTLNLAPAADDKGHAVASPLARDLPHQVSWLCVASASHPKSLEIGAGAWGVFGRETPGGPRAIPLTCPLSPVLSLSSRRWPPTTDVTHSPAAAAGTCPRMAKASAASHTPQLNSNSLPCSGGRFGLRAGLSVVAALWESKRIRAQLPVPDRSPEMAAGPKPASIHSERLRAARDRWVHGRQPRHSTALRTWCCWALLSLGHFLQPIKIAVFLPCLSVPGPPQEKHGCKQSLPSGCPGIGCGEP